jgi:hypothetical protein
MNDEMDMKRQAIREMILVEFPNMDELRQALKRASFRNQLDLQGARHLVTGGCFILSEFDVKTFMEKIGYHSFTLGGYWDLYIYITSSMIMEMIKER